MSKKLEDMVELCRRAHVKVPGKVTDIKQLIDACYRHRCRLAKQLAQMITRMADAKNIIHFSTDGLRSYTNDSLKSIGIIDDIIVLFCKIQSMNADTSHTTVDIRRYMSAKSEEPSVVGTSERASVSTATKRTTGYQVYDDVDVHSEPLSHTSDDVDSTIIEEYGTR